MLRSSGENVVSQLGFICDVLCDVTQNQTERRVNVPSCLYWRGEEDVSLSAQVRTHLPSHPTRETLKITSNECNLDWDIDPDMEWNGMDEKCFYLVLGV